MADKKALERKYGAGDPRWLSAEDHIRHHGREEAMAKFKQDPYAMPPVPPGEPRQVLERGDRWMAPSTAGGDASIAERAGNDMAEGNVGLGLSGLGAIGFGAMTGRSRGKGKGPSFPRSEAEIDPNAKVKLPTLYRGVEGGTNAQKALRVSKGGDLGDAIYFTPDQKLAGTYGGGPDASLKKGTRVVHTYDPTQELYPEDVAYMFGGIKVGEPVRIVTGNGIEIYRGEWDGGGGPNRPSKMNDAIAASGVKVVLGTPDSLGHNQIAVRDASLVQPQPQPGPRVYHGTTKDFELPLKSEPGNYMLDRSLGPHFAADPEVSNSFVMNRINGRTIDAKDDARIFSGEIDPKAKLLDVHQEDFGHNYPNKKPWQGIQSDQYVIERMIMDQAFRKDPALLERYLTQARAVPPEAAGDLARRMVAGEKVELPVDGPGFDLPRFLDNFGGKPYNDADRARAVDLARQSWLDQGYAGLRYKNTSPMEMETANDPTSYLMFQPGTVTSTTSGEKLYASGGGVDEDDPRLGKNQGLKGAHMDFEERKRALAKAGLPQETQDPEKKQSYWERSRRRGDPLMGQMEQEEAAEHIGQNLSKGRNMSPAKLIGDLGTVAMGVLPIPMKGGRGKGKQWRTPEVKEGLPWDKPKVRVAKEVNEAGWYSKAIDAVNNDIKRESGPPEGFLNDLKNAGVSKAEMEAFHLHEWAAQNPQATRDSLYRWLKENERFVVPGRKVFSGQEPRDPQIDKPGGRYGTEDVSENFDMPAGSVFEREYTDRASGDTYIVTYDRDAGNTTIQGPGGRFIQDTAPMNRQDWDTAVQSIHNFVKAQGQGQTGKDGPANWSEYSLDEHLGHGGKGRNPSYAESVPTLASGANANPLERQGLLQVMREKEQFEKAADIDLAKRKEMERSEWFTGDRERTWLAHQQALEANQKVARDSDYTHQVHWPGVRNPMAHNRYEIHDTPEGEKVMAWLEGQSDWGQGLGEKPTREQMRAATERSMAAHDKLKALRAQEAQMVEEAKQAMGPENYATLLKSKGYREGSYPMLTSSMQLNWLTEHRGEEDASRVLHQMSQAQGTKLDPERHSQRLAIGYGLTRNLPRDFYDRAKQLAEDTRKADAEANRYYGEQQTLEGRMNVQDNPLIRDDGYRDRMIKDLVMQAVDQDVAGIAVTRPEIINDWFNLSKVARAVRYDPESMELTYAPPASHYPSDNPVVTNYLRQMWNGPGWEKVRERVPPEKLPDYIGKEAAAKLLASDQMMVVRGGNSHQRLDEPGVAPYVDIPVHQMEIDPTETGQEARGINHAYGTLYPQLLNSYLKRIDPNYPGQGTRHLMKTSNNQEGYVPFTWGDMLPDRGGTGRQHPPEQDSKPIPFDYFPLTPELKWKIKGGVPVVGSAAAAAYLAGQYPEEDKDGQ